MSRFIGEAYTTVPARATGRRRRLRRTPFRMFATMKAAFPGLIVGDIEPVPADPNSTAWLQQYGAWLDAWQAAVGAPLAFLQVDVQWTTEWRSSVENLRQVLVQRGILFGMIYNGFTDDQSDANWIRNAELRFTGYETQGGTTPDLVIFQSWDNHPRYVLPETDPGAFTYLIDRYFRRRTSLSLAHGSTLATGALSDTSGQPLPGAPVTLSAVPSSQSGVIWDYVLQGTVPASASSALIQICVNECGSAALADMDIYSFVYADFNNQKTLDFSNGLTGWAVYGNAQVQLTANSTGNSLQVYAPAEVESIVNSSQFAVTPGSTFSLTIRARISSLSVGSGSFYVIFLTSGTEISRTGLAFAPATLPVGTVQTVGDGSYSLYFGPPNPPDYFDLHASFAGNDSLWPAFASSPLKTTPTISSNGVVNAANFRPTPLSSGTWLTIYGQNLGDAGHWTNINSFVLGGASVSICGQSAVISYDSGPQAANGKTRWQINALIPDGIPAQAACAVVVSVNGQSSSPAFVDITAGSMELFGYNSSVGVLPVVTHVDYSAVGPRSVGFVPATSGETIIAWGTGDCTNPSITVGGRSAMVLFSGRTGPGLCQINFVVPVGLNDANQMTISSSPDTYTLWLTSR